MSQTKLLLVAACALMAEDGCILLAQRPAGKQMAGLWEFPGGKLETGETPEAALVRELAEELAITVDPARLEPFAFASYGYEKFHLLMPLYLCRHWTGEVTRLEHAAFAWLKPQEIKALPLPPADERLAAEIGARLRTA